MFASGMRAASAHGQAPGCTSLARDHHQALFSQPPFGFEDERGESVAVKAGAADLAEVVRKGFFGSVPEETPGDIFKLCRSLRPKRRQHEPHHDCATFN